MFIDTHAHLYLEQFSADIDEVISGAIAADVQKIFLPNIDSTTTKDMLQLEEKYPGTCYPMIGLHPCSVTKDYKQELEHIEGQLSQRDFYGIGETGVDLYWDKTHQKEQVAAFEVQIAIAKENDLPIIIHSRESLSLTIEIITRNQSGGLKGIFHCFNGDIEQCRKIQDAGFLMGLGGVTTFKNAKMDEVIRYMDEDNFVLETDAPYLSPVPYRGKRNQSAYIPIVAEKIASIRGTSTDHIKMSTTQNAKKLFGF